MTFRTRSAKSARHKPEPRQEPINDPYLEQVRKEYEENQKIGEEETERINKLDRRRLREWLESKEQD